MVHRLGTIATILRTAGGLDRKQGTHLHFIRSMVFPVDGGGLEDQVQQGFLE